MLLLVVFSFLLVILNHAYINVVFNWIKLIPIPLVVFVAVVVFIGVVIVVPIELLLCCWWW